MELIALNISEGIGTITLNRPDKYNAFIREMALGFQDALDQCERDESVRVICITGQGKAFSAGQDLQEAIAENDLGLNRIISEHYNPLITRIRNIGKPIVAAVNGIAAGASANIALACDVVIASKSAAFLQAFTHIGLIPDSGGTYFLPRIVGHQKASSMIILGDKISADEAERHGMVYKVFEDEEFEEATKKLCSKLAEMPTYGIALAKQALNKTWSNNLEEQLALEHELQTKAGQSEDYIEGVTAFVEKRKANFKGR